MRISVVVPVLNDEHHLRTLLEKLASQTRQADEIIVVDNGCTDDSAQIARSAGAKVIVERTRGIPAAASAGYDQTSAEIIVRCDADSIPPDNWLEKIHEEFAGNPAIDALTGPGYFYDLPRGLRTLGSVVYAFGYFAGLGSALATVPLWGSNMAFRSSLWEELSHEVCREGSAIHDDLDLSCASQGSFVLKFVPSLRVEAAGRVYARPAGLRASSKVALNTLARHGGLKGIINRWSTVLGFHP